MFTALFVTRLVFNTLISKGWLSRFRMLRFIGHPQIDWLALRRVFWPVSVAAVVLGIATFIGTGATNKEALYDIEFLGGTSVQIDFKPGVAMTDEEVERAIHAAEGPPTDAAVAWLRNAAQQLRAATVSPGEVPGRFVLTSTELTGSQLDTLMFSTLEDRLERNGVHTSGRTATFDGKAAELTEDSFKIAVAQAAAGADDAAERMRSARVQGVGESDRGTDARLSYEIVTTETDRALVQGAIVAVLGDRLAVQQAISFSVRRDERLTKDDFFVVETDDHFLSDVIGGDAHFDVRRYRGGVAVDVVLDDFEEPLPVAMLEQRIREVGLQPEFEDYQGLDTAVFPRGAATARRDGESGYRQFTVVAVDDEFVYEADMDLGRWREAVAAPQLALVRAALGAEKSLSKVVQFAPQIAGQTKNRALFAIVLALLAIVSYIWLRFGTKEYGLAAIVALVHDVAITLGLVAGSYYVFDTFLGTALLLENFKVDLPMIAAILTVIGYSLNDTIVVFDRIRENRGKVSALSPRIVNHSINQTLSRTLLTGVTTLLVVVILYVFGGKGVHGFSFALLAGVIVGTYSSIAIAAPLLQHPRLLRGAIGAILAMTAVGIVFAESDSPTMQWVVAGAAAVLLVIFLLRGRASTTRPAGQPARA
jgi:SecD/SecF fusion protein